VSVWRFGSGSGDGVRWRYRRPVPLTTISACRLPQRGADQSLAPIEHGRFGGVPSSHLGGIGLDLLARSP